MYERITEKRAKWAKAGQDHFLIDKSLQDKNLKKWATNSKEKEWKRHTLYEIPSFSPNLYLRQDPPAYIPGKDEKARAKLQEGLEELKALCDLLGCCRVVSLCEESLPVIAGMMRRRIEDMEALL